MIADSVAAIKAQLKALVADQEREHPVDPFAVLLLAHQLEAQIDMLAKELDG